LITLALDFVGTLPFPPLVFPVLHLAFFGAIGRELAIAAHEILTGWLVAVVANLEMG